jgi:hypothetical protein
MPSEVTSALIDRARHASLCVGVISNYNTLKDPKFPLGKIKYSRTEVAESRSSRL